MNRILECLRTMLFRNSYIKKVNMKTLLIPIDFSAATENVLKYAADFSCDTHIERIILLKSFYVSLYAQLLPSADFVQLSAEDIDGERQKVEEDLNTLGH